MKISSGIKVKLAAGIILTLLTVFVPTVSYLTESRLEEVSSRLAMIEVTGEHALSDAMKIFEEYKKDDSLLSLSLGQRQSAEIEDGFSEMIGLIEAREYELAEVRKDRLCALMLRLGRSLGINFDLI